MIINSIIAGAGGGFNAAEFIQDALYSRTNFSSFTLSGIDAQKYNVEELTIICNAAANNPNVSSWTGGSNFKKITLQKASGQTGEFSAFGSLCRNMPTLEEIRILKRDGTIAKFNSTATAAYAFNGCSNLKTIYAIFNNTGTVWTDAFGGCSKLEDVYFVDKSINGNISFADSPLLTNASLVQIANGLVIATGKTLTLHATAKSNAQALKGTVDANNIFTADASGNVYLSDFITTTKGWTLA